MLRQNLNTFDRQCVFAIEGMPELIAARLRDPAEIAKARVLPYQLMAAYTAASQDVPQIVRDALQHAMEIAVANVPVIAGNVVVCPDVSGSMASPATGTRKGATTAIRCIDVAALVAAALLRVNKSARVLPFENDVVQMTLNPRDSIMTNAHLLASIGGGGTNCSAPLAKLNADKAKVDLVVFVSDNQSWMDAKGAQSSSSQTTGVMVEWRKLKARCPNAKLACIDIQPYGTTQAPDASDILNVGGFSDAVFATLATFARGGSGSTEWGADHWLAEIEQIEV